MKPITRVLFLFVVISLPGGVSVDAETLTVDADTAARMAIEASARASTRTTLPGATRVRPSSFVIARSVAAAPPVVV